MYNLQNSAAILAQPHDFMDEVVASMPCMHWRYFKVHDLLGIRVCAACGYVYSASYLTLNQSIAAWAIGSALK
jgi:hypothetical protein